MLEMLFHPVMINITFSMTMAAIGVAYYAIVIIRAMLNKEQ